MGISVFCWYNKMSERLIYGGKKLIWAHSSGGWKVHEDGSSI